MHMSPSHAGLSKQARNAALFAAMSATFITFSTLVIFFFTHSYVIALAALEAAIDMIVSFTNTKIVQFARKDACELHPYGHGRAESIASLGQASLMAGGAITMLYLAFSHLIKLYQSQNFFVKTETSPWLIVFFGIFAFLTFCVGRWLKKQGTRLNSPALLSDASHYYVDFLSNLSTTIALALIVFLGYEFLDPMLALVFSCVILRVAYKIFQGTVSDLMDRDISPSVKKTAYKIIMETNPKIIDVHRFRGRKSGHRYFFDFHITLPETLTFIEVHEIVEAVEHNLSHHYDGDVSAHPDPNTIRTEQNVKFSPPDD